MKMKEFIFKAVRDGIEIRSDTFGWDSYVYEKLAKLTKYIDYNCKFKADGSCEGEKSSMCCCNSCYSSMGHFRFLSNNYNSLKAYAKNFVERTIKDDSIIALGFWRKGKGCILPRGMRSVVCLKHFCNFSREGKIFTKWETCLLNTLSGKKGNMTINGKRCKYQWEVPERIEAWIKKERK